MQTGLARQPAREQRMDGLAAAQDFSANWFAAYTHSHHEKRVASHFGERQMEAFLPLYATRHRWKNRCEVNLELPLFPNYVFVRIDPRKRVRVLEVPGVLSLLVLDEPSRRSPILKSRHSAPVWGSGKLSPTPTSSSVSGSASRPAP